MSGMELQPHAAVVGPGFAQVASCSKTAEEHDPLVRFVVCKSELTALGRCRGVDRRAGEARGARSARRIGAGRSRGTLCWAWASNAGAAGGARSVGSLWPTGGHQRHDCHCNPRPPHIPVQRNRPRGSYQSAVSPTQCSVPGPVQALDRSLRPWPPKRVAAASVPWVVRATAVHGGDRPCLKVPDNELIRPAPGQAQVRQGRRAVVLSLVSGGHRRRAGPAGRRRRRPSRR